MESSHGESGARPIYAHCWLWMFFFHRLNNRWRFEVGWDCTVICLCVCDNALCWICGVILYYFRFDPRRLILKVLLFLVLGCLLAYMLFKGTRRNMKRQTIKYLFFGRSLLWLTGTFCFLVSVFAASTECLHPSQILLYMQNFPRQCTKRSCPVRPQWKFIAVQKWVQ